MAKQLFPSSDGLALQSLRGAVALNPALRLSTVYVRAPSPACRVAVVAGGGAGHEPAHAGYTGRGMLAASVAGDIFASPAAPHVRAALHLAARPAVPGAPPRDVLVVINNYTGDRLNFGRALEEARGGGVRAAGVVVADDVAPLAGAGAVGPRGLAGNVLVCKVLGAAAEAGGALDGVRALGDALGGSLRSLGVGLERVAVPGRAPPGALGDGLCEIGLGLHGEPGARRVRLEGARALVAEMLALLLVPGFLGSGDGGGGARDDVVLLVNNLGGLSQLELGALTAEVLAQLRAAHIRPARVYAGAYMTSLAAPGFSLHLLNTSAVARTLAAAGAPTADVLALLDAPTDATAWTSAPAWSNPPAAEADDSEADEDAEAYLALAAQAAPDDALGAGNWADADRAAAVRGIRGACARALGAEAELARFDAVCGDGDCGATFAAGARAVLRALDGGALDGAAAAGPAALVRALGGVLGTHMGGTSGALFAIFFAAWAAALAGGGAPARALAAALAGLARHTPARPGDRTVVDALRPLCDALAGGARLGAAAAAAREGARATAGMRARLGRAAYVGADGAGEAAEAGAEAVPDAGAWGVAAVVEGFCAGYAGVGPA